MTPPCAGEVDAPLGAEVDPPLEAVVPPGALEPGVAGEPPELTGTEELAGGTEVDPLAPAAGVVAPTVAVVPLGVDETPAVTPATGVVAPTVAVVPLVGFDETPAVTPATGVVTAAFAAVPPAGFGERPTDAVPPLLPVPVDTLTVVPVGSVAEPVAAGTTTGSGAVTLMVEFEVGFNKEPAAQAGGAISKPEQATASAAPPRAARPVQRESSRCGMGQDATEMPSRPQPGRMSCGAGPLSRPG
jgi:hypothetical protein